MMAGPRPVHTSLDDELVQVVAGNVTVVAGH